MAFQHAKKALEVSVASVFDYTVGSYFVVLTPASIVGTDDGSIGRFHTRELQSQTG